MLLFGPEALDAEIIELLRLEALIEQPTNLQNCHRDLWADNILPTPTGEVCVIDWENCGLADPAQELPMAMIDFARGDHRRSIELYASYVAAGGPARISGYGSFTMVIAQFGHFWEEQSPPTWLRMPSRTGPTASIASPSC